MHDDAEVPQELVDEWFASEGAHGAIEGENTAAAGDNLDFMHAIGRLPNQFHLGAILHFNPNIMLSPSYLAVGGDKEVERLLRWLAGDAYSPNLWHDSALSHRCWEHIITQVPALVTATFTDEEGEERTIDEEVIDIVELVTESYGPEEYAFSVAELRNRIEGEVGAWHMIPPLPSAFAT